ESTSADHYDFHDCLCPTTLIFQPVLSDDQLCYPVGCIGYDRTRTTWPTGDVLFRIHQTVGAPSPALAESSTDSQENVRSSISLEVIVIVSRPWRDWFSGAS